MTVKKGEDYPSDSGCMVTQERVRVLMDALNEFQGDMRNLRDAMTGDKGLHTRIALVEDRLRRQNGMLATIAIAVVGKIIADYVFNS